MVSIEKDVIMAHALDNAISHEGKAMQGSVLNALFAEGLEKEEIKDIIPLIAEVLKKVNSLKLKEQETEFEKLKNLIHKRKTRAEGELPELPGAEQNNVVMRNAPFPSGPLHIGNTRAAILNHEFVKKYNGRFILFFDDTIGSEIKQIEPEAYKLIEEGIKWLGIKPNLKFYKSDRNKIYYAHAEELLKKGYFYVCNCPQEDFQRIKEKGIECPCRHLPTQENIKRWKEMFDKKIPTGRYVVRLKTSMQDPDPAFRDRVMFKISDRTHPRTKNKFRVYPSMEFSWAIDDYLIGTTHVLRGIEHQMSTRVQDFIRNIFGWKNPISIYNGLLEIEGVKISKSKGAKEVKSGQYSGWNDPRLWSLQSLRDRGIKPETIRNFIIQMGLNKSNAAVPIDALYTLNRKTLEDVSRYFFIQDPVKIKISGCPEISAKIPLHPSINKGFKNYITKQEFYISKIDYELMTDGNYRLMHLLNFKSFKLNSITSRDFSFISQEPDKKLNVIMIHWLPAFQENIPIKIMLDNGKIIQGLGEPALKNLKEGQEIQFERFGFVRLHKKHKDHLEFWFAHR
jgi:glutamyl-tRNA synthetase